MSNRKTESLPKISIVIPSYNKASYIDATLRSIINQGYPNLEVIIQDGGSEDGTVEIIKRYANKYPGIFQWSSKKDKGQLDAINRGLKKSSGEILTYINADDIYKQSLRPDGLKQSLRSPNGDLKKGSLWIVGEYFMKHPDTLWVTGYGDIIDKDGKVISQFVTSYKNTLLDVNKFFLLIIVNFITQPSTFLSRKAYLQFGSFTGTRNYVMEYDLWLKIGRFKMPYIIKKTLSSFRLTADNISSTSARELLKIDNQLVKKYTQNNLLLILHKLHNLGRIFLLNFF